MGAFAQQHATGKKTEMSVDLNPVVVTGTGTHPKAQKHTGTGGSSNCQ